MSPARWAGVVLVFASLMTAIVLAASSPADPDAGRRLPAAGLAAPTATASPATADLGLPAEKPRIEAVDSPHVLDDDGGPWTRERELAISVAVPETELRARDLSLLVFLDGVEVASQPRPRGSVALDGIRLAEGPNSLTVRLQSPDGVGPLSEPFVVSLDTQKPVLKVTSPGNNREVPGKTTTVTGQSDVGARVTISNTTTGDEKLATIGPTGTFESVVALKRGRNRIRVAVEDLAGNRRTLTRVVDRTAARDAASLEVSPRRIAVSKLPRQVRIMTEVTDARGKPVRGAEVTFTLGVPGQETQRYEQTTNRSGRASWRPRIEKPVAAGNVATVTVVARLPDGRTIEKSVSAPTFA